MKDVPQSIQNDPAIQTLLSRMPSNVAASFSNEQLMHIKTAIGARRWGKHQVDFRGTFKVPLMPWRYYYVFLLGKNYRHLSPKEKRIALLTATVFTTVFLGFCILIGMLTLYLVKSALGIDIFPGFSLGIWGWFKENVLG